MKTMKKNGGFTLVELIVVIAILAILAAVAIPAYSGYIEKANRAGDEQLLNTLNKAFASACSLNGTSTTELSKLPGAIYTDEDGDGEFTVTGVKNVDAQIAADFQAIFAGNDTTEFKVMKSIGFNPILGMFVDGETEMTIEFNGKAYNIKAESLANFAGSVFAKDTAAMQSQLTGISGAFASVIGNKEAASVISGKFADFMTENNYTDAEIGNAAVLYVAQNAGDYSANDIAQMFQNCSNYINETGDTSLGNIMQNAFDEDDDALTSAALMYGAVTAFANSDKCTDPHLKTTVANVSDGSQLINVFMGLEGNTEWQSYIGNVDSNGQITASDQFVTDMNGFMGAMDALNTVAPGVDTESTDFWKSEEVSGLLGSLLG